MTLDSSPHPDINSDKSENALYHDASSNEDIAQDALTSGAPSTTPDTFNTPHETLKPPPQCEKCNKGPSTQTKLLTCARCQTIKYCGKECQISDWSDHKFTCKRIEAQKAAQAIKFRTNIFELLHEWAEAYRNVLLISFMHALALQTSPDSCLEYLVCLQLLPNKSYITSTGTTTNLLKSFSIDDIWVNTIADTLQTIPKSESQFNSMISKILLESHALRQAEGAVGYVIVMIMIHEFEISRLLHFSLAKSFVGVGIPREENWKDYLIEKIESGSNELDG